MRRRTLICVWFAVALHGAALFALDRWWFSGAATRPPVVCDCVIELTPPEPELVALPVAPAAVVPPPPIAPAVEPEQPPETKLEPKIEPKPELKPELKPEPVIQPKPAPPAPKAVAVVVPVTTVASASATVPVNASVVTAVVNPSSLANNSTSTALVATQPAYLRNPKPTYPASARLKRQQGVVLLAVEVSAKGKPLRVEVETSSGFESLDEEARTTVLRRWRFEPARLDGVPVAAKVQVPIRFQPPD